MTHGAPQEGWVSPRLHGWLAGLATALLYLAPMLAGLGGFGWWALPVFLVLFLGWVIVTEDGRRPAPGALLVQAALIVLCMALGRGIGGLLGASPAFPAWLPFAIGAAALPLAWALRSPRDGDDG